MRIAKEYLIERLGENKYKTLLVNQGIEAWVIAAVNKAREDAIVECAEKAKSEWVRYGTQMGHKVDNQSILCLIDDLK